MWGKCLRVPVACRRAWGWAVEGRARVEAVWVRTAGEWVRYEYPLLIFKVCAKEKRTCDKSEKKIAWISSE